MLPVNHLVIPWLLFPTICDSVLSPYLIIAYIASPHLSNQYSSTPRPVLFLPDSSGNTPSTSMCFSPPNPSSHSSPRSLVPSPTLHLLLRCVHYQPVHHFFSTSFFSIQPQHTNSFSSYNIGRLHTRPRCIPFPIHLIRKPRQPFPIMMLNRSRLSLRPCTLCQFQHTSSL